VLSLKTCAFISASRNFRKSVKKENPTRTLTNALYTITGKLARGAGAVYNSGSFLKEAGP
jgi:uncharacterized Fe-S cluster-containing MiaB family protein